MAIKKKPAPVEDSASKVFVNVDDNVKKRNRQAFRLETLQKNDASFHDSQKEYDGIVKTEKEELEWQRYVSCDKVPNLESPKAIRTYLNKWRSDELALKNSTFNWLLDVDERSILTQDMDLPDLTRKTLKLKTLAYEDVEHVKNGIRMVSGLQELLETKDKSQLELYDDLVNVKHEVRNRIRYSIDYLTYFILFNTEGNMISIDSVSAKYNIETEPFNFSVWALKNVPYDFEKESTELLIDLSCIETEVTLPLHAVCENLVIRGLHEKFDHRSIYATSYKLPTPLPEVEDLRSVLIQEWVSRELIEAEKINEMQKLRANYEAELRIREEEAKQAESNRKRAEKAGGKNQPKKAKKTKRLPPEPALITDSTCFDIEKEFIEMNDVDHELFMESMQPTTLYLDPKEINLREYIILGGIYEFNFLYKPDQLLLPNCYVNVNQMPEKLRYKTFECTVEYDKIKKSNLSQSRSVTRDLQSSRVLSVAEVFYGSKEIPEKSVIEVSEVKLESLIKISVKLPPSLCRWDQPITCRWSTSQNLLPTKRETMKSTLFDRVALDLAVPYPAKDINLNSQKDRNYLHYLTVNQIIPRMDSLHRFPDEVEEEKDKVAALEHEMERLKMEAELDYLSTMAESDHVSCVTQPSKTYDKFRGESTPPSTLFPRLKKVRPLKWIDPRNESEILEENEESEENTESNEKLSEYIKKLTVLQEAGKPYFLTWWAILRLLSKNEPHDSTEEPRDLDEIFDEIEISEKNEDVKIKHGRKSMKKDKEKALKTDRSLTKGSIVTTKSILNGISEVLPTEEIINTTSFIPEPKKITDDEEVYSVTKGSWSSERIYKEEFDVEKQQMTFWTDRLGIYGFAYRRYLHFPFKHWALYPDEKSENKVTLEIWSEFAHFYINVQKEGFTAAVVVGSYPHAKIDTPVTDLRHFIEKIQELGLNIFSERDSSIYVKNISEKHISVEYHTYQSISQYCLRYKFARSKWNWLAHRRVLTFKYGKPNEKSYEMDTVQITPEETQFCTITERCTNLEETVLDYEPTGKNKKFEPDLYSLLTSSSPGTTPHCVKVEIDVFNLLKSVRPLTFCQ